MSLSILYLESECIPIINLKVKHVNSEQLQEFFEVEVYSRPIYHARSAAAEGDG
jgi:hypothetical protein